MKTWPIVNNQGKITAFEVNVIRIGSIAKILESIPGVSQLQKTRPLSGEEVRIHFTLNGTNYEVWEPYGDNSRYWIGPSDEDGQPGDVAEIEKAFQSYQPSLLKRLFDRYGVKLEY